MIIRLTGSDAIDFAAANGASLSKYADPTEGAAMGLSVEDARAIAAEDPSLIYIDVPTDVACERLARLACVRLAELAEEGAHAGRLLVETRPGPNDESEDDYLARLDEEAGEIDAVAAKLGLDRVHGENAEGGAQELYYAAR